MSKLLEAGSLLLILFASLLLGYFLVVQLYPFKMADIKSVEVMKPEYNTGEMLSYKIDYCRYREGVVVMSKSFVNEIVYNLPPEEFNPPLGCRNVEVFSTSIPKDLPAGKYYLRVRAEQRITAFRSVTVEWKTNEFMVNKIENNGGIE